MALAGLIPANVTLMMQIRYHFEHYAPMCKKVSFATSIVGLLWYQLSMKQNENLERLSAKYFYDLSDEQLVFYDQVQNDYYRQLKAA